MLISDYYRRQNEKLHDNPEYGKGGYKHEKAVLGFIKGKDVSSILDYGCGKGTFKQSIQDKVFAKVREYDPAVPEKASAPSPADLVVCTDVLEHIEPENLDNVIEHLFELSNHLLYLAIATRPSNKDLPDGRNAHLIIEPPEWWEEKILAYGGEYEKEIIYKPDGSPKEIYLWIVK